MDGTQRGTPSGPITWEGERQQQQLQQQQQQQQQQRALNERDIAASYYNDRPPSYSGLSDAPWTSNPRPAGDAISLADTESLSDACSEAGQSALNEAIVQLGGSVAAAYFSRRASQASEADVEQGCLSSYVSALYAMMLVVLCLVFTSTEIITDKVPLNFFESCGFYTYLFTVSVLFMLYLFCYVLREKYVVAAEDAVPNVPNLNVEEYVRRITKAVGVEYIRDLGLRPPSNVAASEVVSVKLMTSENERSHGSLFLRVGALAFGLGTLIYAGLEFLTFFEVPKTCRFWEILMAVNPALYMVFVFMQMYFIFVHPRINVNRHKLVANFGMMHLVATNVCVVIRTLVKESAKEIFHFVQVSSGTRLWTSSAIQHQQSKMTESERKDCGRIVVIGDTVEHSSIFLFPFIIEYSIIGTAMLFSMWRNIGANPEFVVSNSGSAAAAAARKISSNRRPRAPLDWSDSSVGLFLGLLSLVSLIISLILYFALVNQDAYRLVAIIMDSATNAVINLFMTLAIGIGFVQTRKLRFASAKSHFDVVMVVTAFGVFVYSVFSIIAGVLNDGENAEPWEIVVANGAIELIEVNLQLLFMFDLRHRRLASSMSDVDQDKPGRQVVTFLLVCNLALWITDNFQIQKVNAAPDQSVFYGMLPWVVIQRITLPLCVFFRFHSTVVLAELWKNTYRVTASSAPSH